MVGRIAHLGTYGPVGSLSLPPKNYKCQSPLLHGPITHSS